MTPSRLIFIALSWIWLSSPSLASRLFIEDADQSFLGRGVDTRSGQLKNYCVEGTRRNFSQESIEIRVYNAKSREELLESRSGSTSIGSDLWIIGGKAKSKFDIRSSETEMRSSFIWSIDYRYGSISLKDPQLSFIGSVASQRNSDSQRQTCGDEFITSMILGARIDISANIVFFSREDYERYKTTIRVSSLGGLIKKKKTFIDEFRNLDMNAVFTVNARQVGGNAEELNKILSTGSNSCDKANIERCLDQFDSLYSYIFSETDELPRDLRLTDISELAPLEFESYSYPQSGLLELNVGEGPGNSEEFLVVSQEIFLEVAKIDERLQQIELKIQYPDYRYRTLSELVRERDQLKFRLERLNSKARYCRTATSLADCRAFGAGITEHLRNGLDRSILDPTRAIRWSVLRWA